MTTHHAYGSQAAKDTIVARAIIQRDAGLFEHNARSTEPYNPDNPDKPVCIVGSGALKYNHASFAETLGVAPAVSYILEAVFENLHDKPTHRPYSDAAAFAVEAFNVLSVGANTAAFEDELACEIILNLFEKAATLAQRSTISVALEACRQRSKGINIPPAEWETLHDVLRTEETLCKQANQPHIAAIFAVLDSIAMARLPKPTAGHASYLYTLFTEQLAKPEDVAAIVLNRLFCAPVVAPCQPTPLAA